MNNNFHEQLSMNQVNESAGNEKAKDPLSQQLERLLADENSAELNRLTLEVRDNIRENPRERVLSGPVVEGLVSMVARQNNLVIPVIPDDPMKETEFGKWKIRLKLRVIKVLEAANRGVSAKGGRENSGTGAPDQAESTENNEISDNQLLLLIDSAKRSLNDPGLDEEDRSKLESKIQNWQVILNERKRGR